MSTQYKRACATCQTASQWVTFSTNTCTDVGQVIKKENYNEILAGANAIRTFGYNGTASGSYYTSTDDGSAEAPNVGSLTNKLSGNSLVTTDYNNLASKLLTSYTAVSSGDTIFGSYWTALKNGLLDFTLEARRYYTTTCYDNYYNYYNYSQYSRYSNYSNYSDCGGGCGWQDQSCTTVYM